MALKLSLKSSLFLLSLVTSLVQADILNVAVASNFTYTLRLLAQDFKSRTGHQLRISSASTGKLYTQIKNGAPFDIFMAADEDRPDRLITEGDATAEFARIYAIGKLVLLSNLEPDKICQDILDNPKLKRLAIANPNTAPYGAAARQTLEKLRRWDSVQPRLVMGENIAQPLLFVSTGSANAGFVAKSMLLQGTKINSTCQWDIPAEMHSPINQKMVVLKKSFNKPASRAFWLYMNGAEASAIIIKRGYDVVKMQTPYETIAR